jgi:hypothetical protein
MKYNNILIGSLASLAIASCNKTEPADTAKGTVKITITNTVKGNPMVLQTGNYTNSFSEQYTITKFKYYLSNVSIIPNPVNTLNGTYYLIDESNPASLSFSFEAPVNTYYTLTFLLGVDSARNVSGAQTGALDPLNDMFWTWNSGYIMAKMEGNSPQSPVVNKKVEYHIGGFTGTNSVLKNIGFAITTPLAGIQVREGKTSEIFIEADVDTWWQGAFNIKFANTPVVTTPGALAKSISDNYARMFTIKEIKNY